MKSSSKRLFQFLTFVLIGGNCIAQVKLKSAEISFTTPANTDDKDWNTQIKVSLFLIDGTLVGVAGYNSCDASTPSADMLGCFCCINPVTKFKDNGEIRGPFSIKIFNKVLQQNIQSGYFTVTMYPNGNDRWVFNPKLTLNFDDGTSAGFASYSNAVIEQDAPTATFLIH
ncbi:MAG TPA: hypothetical protein VNW49_00320 [Puia sp.]|nr:hypothetical protein [Puia sp.]